MFYKYLIPDATTLAEGKAMHFTNERGEFLITKQGGQLVAYENCCPHQHKPLNCKSGQCLDEDGDYIKCHHHGALFSPHNGQCITGPCQGHGLKKATLGVEQGKIYLLLA